MKMNYDNEREQELTALEWQAFLYLAGELNEIDRGNFETQLEHDENAQQALVQTSILLSQLSFSKDCGGVVRETAAGYSVSSDAGSRRQVAAWIFTVASAFLIGLATWVFNSTNEDSVDDGSRLAEVWVEGVGETVDDVEATLNWRKMTRLNFRMIGTRTGCWLL
jgi:hypothetical protein